MKTTGKTILFILTVFICLAVTSCFNQKETPQDLIFFYFESCPSCDDYKTAEDYAGKISKLNKKRRWNGQSYNLVVPEAAEKLKALLDQKNLPDISRSLPLLIIDNDYINGYEAIGERLESLLAD